VRRLFIAVVILIFAAYCWASYRDYTYVAIPTYATVEVDLLGGLTPRQWQGGASEEEIKASASFRREHLRALERRRLQPLEDTPLLVNGQALAPEKPLGKDELEALMGQAVETNQTHLKLRDPEALIALAKAGYRLRNPIWIETGAERRQLYKGGEPLTKAVLDDLLRIGRTRVGIMGAGQPVAPQPATMVMVILIFLALVAALKDALWTPLLALIDERKRDLERGRDLERDNRAEAARIEEETKALRLRHRKAYLARLAATQREALQEADRILNEAKTQARGLRDTAAAEMESTVQRAETELRGQVAAFAQAIAAQILGRAPRSPNAR